MRFAVLEVDAEVAVKAVVDGAGSVGHTVHGRSINMVFIQNEYRPAVPAPCAAVDFFENGGVIGGGGLGIQVVNPAPTDGGEGFAGSHILDGELRLFGNHGAYVIFKPIQHFGGIGLAAGTGAAAGRGRRA